MFISEQDHGVEQHAAQRERVVALQGGFDEVRAEAGDGEDLFDHERAGEDVGGRRAEVRHDRQERAGRAWPQMTRAG